MSITFWNLRRRLRATKKEQNKIDVKVAEEAVTEKNTATEKKPTRKGGAKNDRQAD